MSIWTRDMIHGDVHIVLFPLSRQIINQLSHLPIDLNYALYDMLDYVLAV